MTANSNTPSWIIDGLQALRPPEEQTVSQWADAKRTLDSSSALPGAWRTDFTPYLRQIMDSFGDPEVEEIAFVKSTQVGGTESLLNMMGCAMDNDPGPMMVVYPTLDLAERTSDTRITPMLESTPALAEKYNRDQSRKLFIKMPEMFCVLSGANSPASLSSTAMRYLFLDEIDKFPAFSGKEADPLSLATERTRTYGSSRKIVKLSTPTLEGGPIWQQWLHADTKYGYQVRCPHCGEWFEFQFAQLKFETTDPETARRTAVYSCEHCSAVISDIDKREMILAGRWYELRNRGRRRIAFRLTAFCSPWLRFGDIAAQYVDAKNDRGKLMNFINSWLAEPYKEVDTSFTAGWLLEQRQSEYQAEEVPDGAFLITGGVDVQKDHFWWSIRVWRHDTTSFNLCHGKAFSWLEIEHIMNRTYYDRRETPYVVNLCAIDSGDQTDDVYDFCAKNADWAVAVKGASRKMTARYKRSIINRIGSAANGLSLLMVDTNLYKDRIASCLRRGLDDGGWFLHEDCDAEYAEMIVAEHKVIKRYGDRLETVWEPKTQGRPNHYLDCEVYTALAADVIGLRDGQNLQKGDDAQ